MYKKLLSAVFDFAIDLRDIAETLEKTIEKIEAEQTALGHKDKKYAVLGYNAAKNELPSVFDFELPSDPAEASTAAVRALSEKATLVSKIVMKKQSKKSVNTPLIEQAADTLNLQQPTAIVRPKKVISTLNRAKPIPNWDSFSTEFLQDFVLRGEHPKNLKDLAKQYTMRVERIKFTLLLYCLLPEPVISYTIDSRNNVKFNLTERGLRYRHAWKDKVQSSTITEDLKAISARVQRVDTTRSAENWNILALIAYVKILASDLIF